MKWLNCVVVFLYALTAVAYFGSYYFGGHATEDLVLAWVWVAATGLWVFTTVLSFKTDRLNKETERLIEEREGSL